MHGDDLKRLIEVRAEIDRAYADDRFTKARHGYDLRAFIITALWAIRVDHLPRGTRLPTTLRRMHMSNRDFLELVRFDLPRYEPDWKTVKRSQGCVAAMIRREGACGHSGSRSVVVTNPDTGDREVAEYCSRHGADARRAQEEENQLRASGRFPAPEPNRGGLLPCYLGFGWQAQYKAADPKWEPPALGICADAWSVHARVAAANPAAPRLEVIAREDADPLPPGDVEDFTRPVLMLVARDEE